MPTAVQTQMTLIPLTQDIINRTAVYAHRKTYFATYPVS